MLKRVSLLQPAISGFSRLQHVRGSSWQLWRVLRGRHPLLGYCSWSADSEGGWRRCAWLARFAFDSNLPPRFHTKLVYYIIVLWRWTTRPYGASRVVRIFDRGRRRTGAKTRGYHLRTRLTSIMMTLRHKSIHTTLRWTFLLGRKNIFNYSSNILYIVHVVKGMHRLSMLLVWKYFTVRRFIVSVIMSMNNVKEY